MYDVIVVGGGPAGLAAALQAWKDGLRRVLLVERDKILGGILNQCIHNGFGLHRFKEELTGPEYAVRYIDMLSETGVEVRTDTMVLACVTQNTGDPVPNNVLRSAPTVSMLHKPSGDIQVEMVGRDCGYRVESARAVILAMGCRERTRGAIGIPGDRPAGVLTAGAAQLYVNLEGYMTGRRVVILGSGDIGLIMARRMKLEGAEVLACVEIMPDSGGLTRNIVQCLRDYGIPLYLSHTVTEICGKHRVEQVTVAKVDADRRPILGTEFTIDCDTLLLSVGLIPENELTRSAGIAIDLTTNGPVLDEVTSTSVPGIFACGNVTHVHDLVDFVSAEAEISGAAAAAYVQGRTYEGGKRPAIQLERKGVPDDGKIICVVCPKGCQLTVDGEGNVAGNQCKRGNSYGRIETTVPTRTITSTVRVTGCEIPRCPVKTDRPIPKELMLDAVRLLDGIELSAPVAIGQVVYTDIFGTGASFVTTRALALPSHE